MTSDADSEFQRLVYLDLSTHKTSVLTSSLQWDVEEFELSKDGRLLAFVANEDGISKLHVLDTKTNKELSVPKLPVGVLGGIQWRGQSHELAFSLSMASQPFDVYSVDIVSGKVERWTFSETGGLNTSGFSEPQLIHWKSWDQRSISAFLYKPPAKFSGKHPVIIDIHGGPEGQVRPDFLGQDNYYINELGIALIYPNVRGSTGYGKTFQKLDNGLLREGSYKDINSLLDWIQTQHVDGCIAQTHTVADQYSNSTHSYQQCTSQPKSEPPRFQDYDFRQSHECWNRRHHHGGDARGHPLLCPEHPAVIQHKYGDSDQCCRKPFPRGWRWRSLRAHPTVQDYSCEDEPHPSQQKWRHFSHANSDRKKCRSPYEVDDRERENQLPRTGP